MFLLVLHSLHKATHPPLQTPPQWDGGHSLPQLGGGHPLPTPHHL